MITDTGLLISSAPLVMLSITKPTSANVKQGLIVDLLVKEGGLIVIESGVVGLAIFRKPIAFPIKHFFVSILVVLCVFLALFEPL